MTGSHVLKWHKNGSPAKEEEWGLDSVAPHEMLVFPEEGGHFSLALEIRKKNEQSLPLSVNAHIDELMESWNRDGWMEIDRHVDGENFFAIRYIPLKVGYLVWVVNHKSQVADDTFEYYPGNIEHMRVQFARDSQ